MKKVRFEIQNCIDVILDAEDNEDIEDVRVRLIDKLQNYAEDMIATCYVTKGEVQ